SSRLIVWAAVTTTPLRQRTPLDGIRSRALIATTARLACSTAFAKLFDRAGSELPVSEIVVSILLLQIYCLLRNSLCPICSEASHSASASRISRMGGIGLEKRLVLLVFARSFRKARAER